MKYELTVITSGEQAATEATTAADAVKKVLDDQGATAVKRQDWGRRDLAYPINKEQMGYYTTFEFDIEGSKVAVVERALQLNKSIVRFLTVQAYAEAVSLAEPVKEVDSSTARSAEESLRRSSKSTTKPATKKKVAKVTKIAEGELEEKVDEALHKILEGEDNKDTNGS